MNTIKLKTILQFTGDKLGDKNLHLYWADFVNGIGLGSRLFRKVKIELII